MQKWTAEGRAPGGYWQIDFTGLRRKGGLKYLLVKFVRCGLQLAQASQGCARNACVGNQAFLFYCSPSGEPLFLLFCAARLAEHVLGFEMPSLGGHSPGAEPFPCPLLWWCYPATQVNSTATALSLPTYKEKGEKI